MSSYRIYLGNPHRLTYRWHDLCVALRDLFNPVVAHTSRFSSVWVGSTMTKPSLEPHELLIYVLPQRGDSVVGPEYGVPTSNLGDDGFTAWRRPGEVGSEVYKHDWEPGMLAKLAYHEAMHNKLRYDNRRLHRLHGLASRTVEEDTRQRDRNSRLMGRNLHRHVPQWLGGFDAVI